MDRINHPTAPGGRFTDPDTGTGTPGTTVPAAHLNAVQDELITVIESAGLTPAAGDLTQLTQAIPLLGGNAQGLGNRVLNGGMGLWQRGTSFTASTTAEYTADRWRVVSDGVQGGGVGTVTKETGAFQSGVAPGTWDFLRYTPNVPADQGGPRISTRLEVLEQTADRQMTLSFLAKGSIADSLVVEVRQVWTGTTRIVQTSSLTLGTTWERFEIPIAMPSVAGENLAGSTAPHVEIEFRLPNVVATVFDLSRVQFEEGANATDFEERPEALELGLCQRYFRKSFDVLDPPGTVAATGEESFPAAGPIPFGFSSVRFDPPMRTVPAIRFYDPNGTAEAIRWGTQTFQVAGTFSASWSRRALPWPNVLGTPPTALEVTRFHYTADAEL